MWIRIWHKTWWGILAYARIQDFQTSFLGTWECSGLVVECLRSPGVSRHPIWHIAFRNLPKFRIQVLTIRQFILILLQDLCPFGV